MTTMDTPTILSGQGILDEEKKHRLGRMIEALKYDLMHLSLTPEAREEALSRVTRWAKEYES